MYKHWAVVIAMGAMMLAATLWTSCGEDEGADTGPAAADSGGGGKPDSGGGGTPDAGGGEPGPCDDAEFGDPCEGGYCVGTKCFESCDEVGAECSAGGCYFMDVDQYVCGSAGSKVEGEACAAINDCDVGFTCLDDGTDTDSFVCFSVCAEDADCTDPATCVDTELGFNVCAE